MSAGGLGGSGGGRSPSLSSQDKPAYALGRQCKLTIEDKEITGASDVSVRESVTEIDATAFNAPCTSSIVTMRSYEITFSCPDIEQAKLVRGLREKKSTPTGNKGAEFWMPQVVSVRLEGGLFDIEYQFTIHDIEADEPLDGSVVPRFVLKQWWQPSA